MQETKPKVYLIQEPRINEEELQRYLDDIGAPDWETDALSDAERLIEVAGRVCYRSFKPGLNANVTKVREGNLPYIQHVIGQRHGSVLEHPQPTFIFGDVSRVFTHELVRHRAGVAISQESLRYVRLTDLKCYVPECFKNNAWRGKSTAGEPPTVHRLFIEVVEHLEETQKKLAQLFDIDGEDFPGKKMLTSAMRRLAPLGLATTIVWSANLRTLRFVIEQRTSLAAEEEIRLVFNEVARLACMKWPAVFADFKCNADNEWVSEHRKV